MSQLLIEIFSEEIPARMQQGGARDLERMASDAFKKAGLTWDSLTTYGGPRRLTLVVEGLPTATPDLNEELKGPKTSAPAQALEGFLRKTGLTQDQLVERDGVYYAQVSQKGRATTEVVAETLDHIFHTMSWPKSQRWGSGSFRWVRPIHRIIALFDGAVIPYALDLGSTIGGEGKKIIASNVTEGHRFMGAGQPFEVTDFADYRTKLERNFVVLSFEDRKAKVLEGAKAVCAAKGLELVDDIGLLDEVAGLAEWPTPILGDMDPQFLSLPPEVVRLSMKVHQKYFAVRQPGAEGLAPHYVVVANVEAADGGKALAAGNTKVLSARLNDARFFWEEDQKVGFDKWNEKLSGVTFHAKLGTMAERVERIAKLAAEIAPLVGADAAEAEKAARLSKADLASGMVGEFPELQGIMGGYYARLAGQPDAIADAIRDHYKPQGPSDSVPTAPLTVAIALADKIDTLSGFFSIDEKPTGSKDPYALRRAALGVTRLILEVGRPVPLVEMIVPAVIAAHASAHANDGVAVQDAEFKSISRDMHDQIVTDIQRRYSEVVNGWNPYPQEGASTFFETVEEVRATSKELLAFFADRLTVLLRDQGQRHDLVVAVFALGDDDLVRIVSRVEALSGFLATDDGANLLAGYKRASNILKAEEKKGALPSGEVTIGMANQPAEEVALAEAAKAADAAVAKALETEDFAAAMTALAALRAPVDAFFTGVMVNSENKDERDNRLKLLVQVREIMGRVADFGQIAG
ncbi:glycine--tRNA ligase subunit beta [uncultured Brevundimonas sp.]|uniref:glycine--tRNA ligase subunit beta n=1 Tax=uncultured Brevundimonas sp. TaxID=213418 RepID=UPI0026097CFE|nr:glycine--tRNA ligase subunit beta [uncultured Brevundimonas sp.]